MQTDWKPTNAVMNITDECNFACRYCFVDFNPKVMTIETARQSAEWMLKNAEGQDKRPTISFFGGEPLLRFKEIIVPLVEEYHEKIEFGLTTNGSLLNEEVVDFCVKYKIMPLLSMDGDRITQNNQRATRCGGDSFDKVMANIPYLLLKIPDTMFRATVTKFSIPYLYENYQFAKHMGFSNCTFIINSDEEYDEEDEIVLQGQFDKIALEICEAIRKVEMPAIRFIPIVKGMQQYIEAYEKKRLFNTGERCGLGTVAIGIDCLGRLHPCQENNSTEKFIVGDVFKGIDREIHENFLDDFKENYEAFIERERQNGHGCVGYKLFRINAECPKKLYDDNNYTIVSGWNMWNNVMIKTMYRLYYLYRFSLNPMAKHYFELYNTDKQWSPCTGCSESCPKQEEGGCFKC